MVGHSEHEAGQERHFHWHPSLLTYIYPRLLYHLSLMSPDEDLVGDSNPDPNG